MAKELTLAQVLRMLERMADGWPEYLELFSASGTLVLIDHRVHGDDGSGTIHTDAVVWDSSIIRTDGGDPDWIQDGEYEPRPAATRPGEWMLGTKGLPRPADKHERACRISLPWDELIDLYGAVYETEM